MLVKEPWFGIRFVNVMVPEHTVRTSRKDRSTRWREDTTTSTSIKIITACVHLTNMLTFHPGNKLIG